MNLCTAIIPDTTNAVCGAYAGHWYHDEADHRDCEADGCMYHEFTTVIDMTPTWAALILPLAEAYADGSVEARDELLRLARHVDGMRGKATK